MATEYGLRLKLARTNAGMTQVQLAKKTGIPQSTISTAEREGAGSRETPVYAQALGVSALWLATGQGAPDQAQSGAIPPFYTGSAKSPPALANSAQGAINLDAGLAALANAILYADPVDRAAAKAYLIGLCDAPDRADLRDKIRNTLEPPPAQKPLPETGAKRAA